MVRSPNRVGRMVVAHGGGRWGSGIVAAMVLAATGCQDSSVAGSSPAVVDLSVEWRVATPESQGLDKAKLQAAIRHAATLPRILSLLVVRHGRLVAEEYYHGDGPDSLNDVRSVTKSVVSTLIGIAEGQGRLALDAPIGDHLPAAQTAGLDPGKLAVTVENLLTMSSGFAWDESTVAGYNEWVQSADPVGFLLAKPLRTAPGRAFLYNSAAVHLLSVVLDDAVGMSPPAFAQRYLFQPLGITRARWEQFPDGRANGGAGLALRPRDLAKLGALWLQHGNGGDAVVVPKDYLDRGTAPKYPLWVGDSPLAAQSYGYLWWLDRRPGRDDYFAWGYGGQFVWVAPSLDLVVVVTTEWRNAGNQSGQLASNGLDLIINRVMPAVR